MKLTREEIQHIALLARLGLSEEEVEKFRAQLSDILGNFEVLQQVDTSAVPPTAQTIDLTNTYREDVSQESCPRDDIMANAPMREDDNFKVRAVLEE